MLGVISIIILIFYALIHATDVALQALNDKRLEDMKAEGKKGVKALKRLYGVSDRYTAAVRQALVLLAVVQAILAVKSRAGEAVVSFFAERGIEVIGYIVIVLACIILLSLVGEMVPRKLAAARYENFAIAMHGFMQVVYIVMFPLNIVLELLTAGVALMCGVDPKTSPGQVTEEGILYIVEEGEESGVIDED